MGFGSPGLKHSPVSCAWVYDSVVAAGCRFFVRDYEYDSKSKEESDKQQSEIKADVQKKYNALVRWCTTMFGEAFIAWMHTKALRLFVESVLRYGLPVNFLAVAIESKKSSDKKVRQILAQTYKHLDSSGGDVSHVTGCPCGTYERMVCMLCGCEGSVVSMGVCWH